MFKIRDHLDVDLPPLIEGIYGQSCDEWVATVTSSVMGSVTGETRTSDGRDGCDDFSETSNKNQSSSVGLLEKVIVSSEPRLEIEKIENNPSQPSHSTSTRVPEDGQPVTTHHKVMERGELIKRIDYEMERLGWSTNTGKEYLVSKYGVSSRKRLSEDQLLEFYNNLKAASHQPRQETPDYAVGKFLQGLIPHPVTGTMKLVGKVIEVNGDHQLEDKQGVTYPLSVMEQVKVLSWSEYNG